MLRLHIPVAERLYIYAKEKSFVAALNPSHFLACFCLLSIFFNINSC